MARKLVYGTRASRAVGCEREVERVLGHPDVGEPAVQQVPVPLLVVDEFRPVCLEQNQMDLVEDARRGDVLDAALAVDQRHVEYGPHPLLDLAEVEVWHFDHRLLCLLLRLPPFFGSRTAAVL